MLENAKLIIDDAIGVFMENIRHITSVNDRYVIKPKSQFEIFNIASDDFFNSIAIESRMENFVRKNLVIECIASLLDLFKINYYIPKKDDGVIHVGGNFDEINDFVFIIDRVGFKFSYNFDPNVHGTLDEIFDFFKEKYSLDDINIICFDKVVKNTFEHDISIQNFFKKYLSNNVWEYYYNGVFNAIKEAKILAGFTTVKNLTLRNLSDFKERKIEELKNWNFQDNSYSFSKKAKEYSFNIQDKKKINSRFFGERMYQILVGKDDFAKCFITAEYLYENMKNQNHFDYTSVVCGYLKSIENLLYMFFRSSGDDIGLRYSEWNKEKFDNSKSKDIIEIKDNSYKENSIVVLKKTKNKYIELKDLINKIFYDEKYWYLSKEGRILLNDILDDYRSSCRNEHFHIDNIYTEDEVDRIRKNTWLCLYYLLGGVKLLNNFSLDFYNEEYNKIYKAIMKIPRSVKNYLICFGEKEFKAIRPYFNVETTYDEESGLVATPLRFILVNDFDEVDLTQVYNFDGYKTIEINSTNIPTKIYWYNIYAGKNEIHW